MTRSLDFVYSKPKSLLWNTFEDLRERVRYSILLGFSQKSRMFSFGALRTPESRLGAEKSNPRDKRDLLDHRTACQADFTLRKQTFKLDFGIFWRKYLLERLKRGAVLHNHWFSANGQEKETFCATESEVERSFELQRKQPAREQNLSYKPQGQNTRCKDW